MPASLHRLALSSTAARNWLIGAILAAALLAGAGLVSHLLVDRTVTAEPAPEPVGAAQRLAQQQCAEAAFLFHDVRWAAACMVLAEQDEWKHAACLNDPAIAANPQLGKDYCDKTFALRDGSPECDLPDARAASLHALLRDAEEKCRAEALAEKTR